MGKQLIFLALQFVGSLSIFHRWYIPHTQLYPVEKGARVPRDWMGPVAGKYNQKRASLPLPPPPSPQDDKILKDCMTVSHSEEGRFTYISSSNKPETCGLYLVGRPNQRIVVSVESIQLSNNCDEDAVVLVDGWELNGHVIPSDEDHSLPFKDRFVEVCESGRRARVVSSQNAAMVQYKISGRGLGFTVSVKYIDNPDPCNVLMSEMTGIFTISNNGQHRNCSVTTLLFPAKISLLEVNVGSGVSKRSSGRVRRGNAGILPQCLEDGERDFLELGGSEDLDSINLETKSTLCGYDPEPINKDLTILCGSSTVRLVSSGEYRNSVTALVQAATEDDLDQTKNIIMTCPKFFNV